MKIKLAILEKDQSYLSRIVSVFSTKYADKFEIYSFTDQNIALSTLDSNRIDVLIASDIFEIDVDILPKRCGFAYFVESANVDTVNEQYTICKFQKVELIYKQILSIYAEHAGSVSGVKNGEELTKILIFSSPGGGAGTSSIAAACAVYFAAQKKKTLYLNLEKLGSADAFFSAEGLFDMSDIIYALKSKKTNISMKLESCVKQDESGVYFYSHAKVALDMLEIGTEDIMRLISELEIASSYDYIIMDMDFSMDKDVIRLYKRAHAVVWVGDGSEVSNIKIQRAYRALAIVEQNADVSLLSRLCLIYNKFSNKKGNAVDEIGLKVIGGAPVYIHANTKQVIEQLATMTIYEKIL